MKGRGWSSPARCYIILLLVYLSHYLVTLRVPQISSIVTPPLLLPTLLAPKPADASSSPSKYVLHAFLTPVPLTSVSQLGHPHCCRPSYSCPPVSFTPLPCSPSPTSSTSFPLSECVDALKGGRIVAPSAAHFILSPALPPRSSALRSCPHRIDEVRRMNPPPPNFAWTQGHTPKKLGTHGKRTCFVFSSHEALLYFPRSFVVVVDGVSS